MALFTYERTETNYQGTRTVYEYHTGRIAAAVVVAFLLLITFCASCAIIPTGHTGVVKRFGAPTGSVLSNGLHFKVPFAQSVVKVNNQIQMLEVTASAASKDMQAITTVVAVNYKVLPASSVDIVLCIGEEEEYKESVLSPAVQECVKSVTAKYTAEGLITERAKVGTEISEAFSGKVSQYGIYIEQFNIVNFDFSEALNKAVEEKQVALQNLIKVETNQKAEVVKAKAQAEIDVVKAQAKEDAAKSNAAAVLIDAEAQAEANRKLAASLSPDLVEYEKIKKWNGTLPSVSCGNAIVDFRK
jgi:regulator of protease activity HflC (stomatin/prohibitin superfamily)